jgi:hypothetical protein
MKPTKLEILKNINVGHRVAEDEADDLLTYFVETSQWEQLSEGLVDVVYGPKGSGKSALYTSLIQQSAEFRNRNVIVTPAENPRGATVFKTIVSDAPPTETEFIALWKLYILIVAAKTLRKDAVESEEATHLISSLETARLLPPGENLASYFKSAADYLKKWIGRDPTSVEYELSIDPASSLPIIKRRAKFSKKTKVLSLEALPLDDLIEVANRAFANANMTIWIAFDRLDVAFAETPDLERNALRALFRVYNDMLGRTNIKLKIFVRDDIWRRITQGGFREASHITKALHITWSPESLLNLLVLRLIKNASLCASLNVSAEFIKASYEQQVKLFYRFFPDKVNTGKNPPTLKWIISRTSDGSGKGNPREVIHLVDAARKKQIDLLQQGNKEPILEILIDRPAIIAALPLVSKVFYEQTLLAEDADLKRYLQAMDGQKATQRVASLALVWGVDTEEASNIARRLVDIGFFEAKGNELRVPYILRPALNLIQGQASS